MKDWLLWNSSNESVSFNVNLSFSATDGTRGVDHTERTSRCLDPCRYDIRILTESTDKVLCSADIGECY